MPHRASRSAWSSEQARCWHRGCLLVSPVHLVHLLPVRRTTRTCLPERGAEECPTRLAMLPVCGQSKQFQLCKQGALHSLTHFHPPEASFLHEPFLSEHCHFVPFPLSPYLTLSSPSHRNPVGTHFHYHTITFTATSKYQQQVIAICF